MPCAFSEYSQVRGFRFSLRQEPHGIARSHCGKFSIELLADKPTTHLDLGQLAGIADTVYSAEGPFLLLFGLHMVFQVRHWKSGHGGPKWCGQ